MKSKFNVHENDVQPEKVKSAEGWREVNIRLLLSERTVGCKSACLYKAVIKVGAAHGKHRHHRADELVYVISGKGKHGQGDEIWEIGPGDSYYIPRGVAHWAHGTDSEDPLVLLGTYVGAGSLEETGYEFVGE